MTIFRDAESADPAVLAFQLMHRAHLQDGLPELFIGIMLLVLGASFWVQILLVPSMMMTSLFLMLTIAFVLLCFRSTALVKWIRRRYLVERVGYIESRLDEPSKRRHKRKQLAILLASLSLLMVIMVMDLLNILPLNLGRSIILFLGIVFCGAFLSFGTAYRFKVNGILALIAGLFLAFREPPLQTAVASFLTAVGSVNLISGLFVFFRFMRRTSEDARA